MIIKNMLEKQIKKYESLRDGSLKQWDSTYKTYEYKRRGIEEFLQIFDDKLYNPLIEKIKEESGL